MYLWRAFRRCGRLQVNDCMPSGVGLASISLTRAFPCCAALMLAALSLSFTHFFKECIALVARWLAKLLAGCQVGLLTGWLPGWLPGWLTVQSGKGRGGEGKSGGGREEVGEGRRERKRLSKIRNSQTPVRPKAVMLWSFKRPYTT